MRTGQYIPADLKDRLRILVVEDNPLNQKLDSFILSNWGLQHDICANGRQAVDTLRSKSYDLVLMDIRMPVLDGYEATRIIRNDLKMEIPIVGITALPSAEEMLRCRAVGMSNYLSKPIHEEELFSVLCSHLSTLELEDATEEE